MKNKVPGIPFGNVDTDVELTEEEIENLKTRLVQGHALRVSTCRHCRRKILMIHNSRKHLCSLDMDAPTFDIIIEKKGKKAMHRSTSFVFHYMVCKAPRSEWKSKKRLLRVSADLFESENEAVNNLLSNADHNQRRQALREFCQKAVWIGFLNGLQDNPEAIDDDGLGNEEL